MSQLSDDAFDPIEPIATEFLERLRAGEAVTIDEYARKYPNLAESIRYLFPAMKLLEEVAPTPDDHLHPQQIGSIKIQELLGSGGMGIVYAGIDERTQQPVAVKTLGITALALPQILQRFDREFATAASCTHPNIVKVYEFTNSEVGPAIIMERLHGQDLQNRVTSEGPMSFDEVLKCLTQIASGLAYAHERGIIHRDIKPANIFQTTEGDFKILDLGMAHSIDFFSSPDDPGRSPITAPDSLLGTLDYMAPEQASNPLICDPRADVYSLGCTLFFLLTGRPPYHAPTSFALFVAHREAPTPDLQQLRPGMPSQLSKLLVKMMAKHPSDRPSDGKAILNALVEKNPSILRWVRMATIGMLFLILAAMSLNKPTEPLLDSIETITQSDSAVAWTQLVSRMDSDHRGGDESVWFDWRRELAEFRATWPGTPEANLALQRLSQLPTALDLHVAQKGDSNGQIARLGNDRLSHWYHVSAVRYHLDGTRLFSGSWDGTVVCWDAKTGEAIWRTELNDWIDNLEVGLQGKCIAVGLRNGQCVLLNQETGTIEATLGKIEYSTWSQVAISDDERLIAYTSLSDHSIRLWDRLLKQPIAILGPNLNKSRFSAVRFLGRDRVVSAMEDGTLQLWRIESKNLEQTIRVSTSAINGIAVSPDTKMIAVTTDQNVTVWNTTTCMKSRIVDIPGSRAVIWLHDGKSLGITSRSGSIIVATPDMPLKYISHFSHTEYGIAASPDGKRLAVGGHDCRVRIWEIESKREVLAESGGSLRCVAANIHGVIAAGGADGKVRIWLPPFDSDGKPNQILEGHRKDVLAIAFTPNGDRILSAGWDGTIREWDWKRAQQVAITKAHSAEAMSLAISPDGIIVASGGRDGKIMFWNRQTREATQFVNAITDINGLAFTPDGTLLASVDGDAKLVQGGNGLRVWNLQTALEVVRSRSEGNVLWGVAIHPDGERIAISGFWPDSTIREFEFRGKSKSMIRLNVGNSGRGVAYSPDGHLLAASASDGKIHFWDVGQQKERPILRLGPSNGVLMSCCFTPNGRHLIVANANGTIHLFRVANLPE